MSRREKTAAASASSSSSRSSSSAARSAASSFSRLVAAGADVKIKNKDGDDAKKLATGKNKDKLLAALRGKLDSIGEGKGGKKGCVIM